MATTPESPVDPFAVPSDATPPAPHASQPPTGAPVAFPAPGPNGMGFPAAAPTPAARTWGTTWKRVGIGTLVATLGGMVYASMAEFPGLQFDPEYTESIAALAVTVAWVWGYSILVGWWLDKVIARRGATVAIGVHGAAAAISAFVYTSLAGDQAMELAQNSPVSLYEGFPVWLAVALAVVGTAAANYAVKSSFPAAPSA